MAFGNDVVLMASAAGLTVSVRVTLLVCTGDAESRTAKVIDEPDTAAVGVPDITPVEAARTRPAGNVPPVMLQA